MLAVLRSWQVPRTANVRNRPSQERRHTQVGGVDCLRRFLLEGGSPGNADWEGRKADSTGIGPVHLEWTIVDGGEKMRVPAKPRRLLRGHRDAPRSGAVPAYRLFGVSSVGVSGALAVCRSRQRARLAAIFLSL